MATSRLLAAVAALALTGVSSASIFSIDLSTHSSEETLAASFLDATLDFSVVGNTLTLSVTNNTSGMNAYDINQVFFNFGGGVTGVAADVLPAGWALSSDEFLGGFGTFDVGLIGPNGLDDALILPGETEVFQLTFTGMGGVKDFTTAISSGGFLVAAKFVIGPEDFSAFGATIVPAPGALVLLGVAGALSRRRRRRH